jgi:hypothetical protein
MAGLTRHPQIAVNHLSPNPSPQERGAAINVIEGMAGQARPNNRSSG